MLLEVRIDRLIPHMHSIIQVRPAQTSNVLLSFKGIVGALDVVCVSFCSTCCSARRMRMRTWRWRRVNSGWLWRSSPSVKRLCQDTWSSEYCRPSSSSPHTSEHTPNTQMKPLFSSVWGCVYTASLNAQIWSYDHIRFFGPSVYINFKHDWYPIYAFTLIAAQNCLQWSLTMHMVDTRVLNGRVFKMI